MQRETFQRSFNAGKWLIGVGFVMALILLSDWLVDGGAGWLAALPIVPGMIALGVLVFTRCIKCRRSLGWISTHKNFGDQPDPATLDICPHCGEPFFAPSTSA